MCYISSSATLSMLSSKSDHRLNIWWTVLIMLFLSLLIISQLCNHGIHQSKIFIWNNVELLINSCRWCQAVLIVSLLIFLMLRCQSAAIKTYLLQHCGHYLCVCHSDQQHSWDMLLYMRVETKLPQQLKIDFEDD